MRKSIVIRLILFFVIFVILFFAVAALVQPPLPPPPPSQSSDITPPLPPPSPPPLSGDITSPVRSGGLPSGTLTTGTPSATISLATNEAATCRYSTTANVAYSSMANTFTITGGTAHSRSITGLANGNSYSYYVRCIDGVGNANTDDFQISFSVAIGSVTPECQSLSGFASPCINNIPVLKLSNLLLTVIILPAAISPLISKSIIDIISTNIEEGIGAIPANKSLTPFIISSRARI